MRAKFINELADSIFRPKSKEEIISSLKKLSIEEKNNLLINAAFNGYRDVVELLISVGANVDVKTIYGMNAFMGAAACGRKDVVELLLNVGADVNAKDNDGWSALTYAVWNGKKDVVDLLKKYGAKE